MDEINTNTITLIGFGIAGQLLLSYILQTIPAYKVVIIDPDFIGGDLARKYNAIHSNTTIEQTCDSLSSMPCNWLATINALKGRGENTGTVLLAHLAHDMRKTTGPLASKCRCIYDRVISTTWSPEKKSWSLTLENDKSKRIETAIICFCVGMQPRLEDYGIPIIPLSIALDLDALKRILEPGQHVTVIGSAHSATLILRNLNAIPDISAACAYRGSRPFKFARDGEYGGIKQESAVIADSILKGDYMRLILVPLTDTKSLSKTIRASNWIVQATGFKSEFPEILCKAGGSIIPTWDAKTGMSVSPEIFQAYAFGACAPDTTVKDGIIYSDISIGSFIDQLTVRWPLLKATIQNLL